MLEGYKHLASSIGETPERQFASLDIKEKINSLENAIVENHTFNSDIMIKDTSYGMVNIKKIEGNTVINLVDGAVWSGHGYDNMYSNDLKMNVIDNTYCHINCYDWELGKTFFLSPVKLTVCFEVVETPENIGDIVFTFVDNEGRYGDAYKYAEIYKIDFGKCCLHMNLNPGNARRLTPRFFINCQGITGTNGRLRIINFSIYEGEHEFNSTQEYITGIDGVGEDGYIKLSSCSRNMFNHNLPVASDKIEVLGENEYKTSVEWQKIQHFPLSTNRKFYMSAELKTDIYDFHIRANNIMRIDYNRGSVVPNSEMPQIDEVNIDFLPTEYTKFNTGLMYIPGNLYENVNVLMINANTEGSNLYAKNLMLQEVMTEDDIVHEYEPYIGSEINIKVNSSLHGLPNGTRDSIEIVDGDYAIVRRCKKVKLGSYLNWEKVDIESSSITRFRTSVITNVKAQRSIIKSNFVPFKELQDDLVHPGIFIEDLMSGTTTYICVDIPNSIFNDESPTAEQFGVYLNDRDYRIIVELKNPVIEKLDNVEEFNKLLLFDGVTHISGYDNTVFPLVTVEVPTNLAAEMDSVEFAINNLEKEVAEMENIGLTSVMTIIDRREDL